MALIDDLSVQVSADTADFRRDMSAAERALQGVSDDAILAGAAMQALQGRTDEAGDEMSQLAVKSQGASGGLTSAAASAFNAQINFGSLSVVTAASLVPALFTLSAALVPVVSALGGLVAVAGAIAGVGIVGAIGAIATNTEVLKSEFTTTVNVLKEELAPAFDLATQVLMVWMETLRDVASELLPTESALSEVAGAFAQLGEVLIESLPMFTELAVALTQEFLPPFTMWLDDILPQLPGMISAFVASFRRMIPRFMEAGRLLRELLPPLLEFGFTALSVVGPALADLAASTTNLITSFNSLDAGLQSLLTSGSLVLPIITAMVGVFGGLSAPVLAAVGAVVALAAAYQKNVGGIQTTVNNLGAEMGRVFAERLPSLLDAFRQFWDTWGDEISTVANVLIRVFGTGLVNAVDLAASSMEAFLLALSGDWSGAVDVLLSSFERLATRVFKLVNDLTGGAFADLTDGLLRTINEVGRIIQAGADELGVDLNIPDFDPIAMQDVSQQAMTPADRNLQEAANQQQETTVEVRVEGDTDLVRQVSAQAIDRQRRGIERQTGGRTQP